MLPIFVHNACYLHTKKGAPLSSVKTEAVSVRVEPEIKAALLKAADREMRSLANMVEVMVIAYCRSNGYPLDGISDEKLPSIVPKQV